MFKLRRGFTDRTAREVGNVVETVKDGIQNAILVAMESIITPKIELTGISKNASSRQDAASVIANLENWEQAGLTASIENVSDRVITFPELNLTLETQGLNPDKVSKFRVSGTHVDRQPYIHHSTKRQIIC